MNQNLCFNSVEVIPDLKASAAFTVNSSEVFREQTDMNPLKIDEGYEYMPWGADNEMPYKIMELTKRFPPASSSMPRSAMVPA